MELTKTFLLIAALPALSVAEEVKITLPSETSTFKAGKGVELAQAHCIMCHSTEYIAIQPPMPRAFWEGVVKKMTEKFGAPTPADKMAAIADYLSATYGVAEKK